MVKEVFFVRHGQSEFNAWRKRQFFTPSQWLVSDPMIQDAVLTQVGHQQAIKQRTNAAKLGDIQLFVCSPLTRAVQTMRLMFPDSTSPVILTPLVREKMNYACDVGQPTSSLRNMYPDYQFHHFEGEYWWKHRPESPFQVYRETTNEVKQRISLFRDFIQSRPEGRIAVIAHGYFIQMALGHILMPGNCEICRVEIP